MDNQTTAPMKKYNTPFPMPALTNHLTTLFKTLLKIIFLTTQKAPKN